MGTKIDNIWAVVPLEENTETYKWLSVSLQNPAVDAVILDFANGKDKLIIHWVYFHPQAASHFTREAVDQLLSEVQRSWQGYPIIDYLSPYDLTDNIESVDSLWQVIFIYDKYDREVDFAKLTGETVQKLLAS